MRASHPLGRCRSFTSRLKCFLRKALVYGEIIGRGAFNPAGWPYGHAVASVGYRTAVVDSF